MFSLLPSPAAPFVPASPRRALADPSLNRVAASRAATPGSRPEETANNGRAAASSNPSPSRGASPERAVGVVASLRPLSASRAGQGTASGSTTSTSQRRALSSRRPSGSESKSGRASTSSLSGGKGHGQSRRPRAEPAARRDPEGVPAASRDPEGVPAASRDPEGVSGNETSSGISLPLTTPVSRRLSCGRGVERPRRSSFNPAGVPLKRAGTPSPPPELLPGPRQPEMRAPGPAAVEMRAPGPAAVAKGGDSETKREMPTDSLGPEGVAPAPHGQARSVETMAGSALGSFSQRQAQQVALG